MFGAAQINTTDLTKMEGNIFMAGSSFALILLITSLWLVAVFPGFIRQSVCLLRSLGFPGDVGEG
jgi:uncharacterized membrane protein YobD (UPF0266 family)